MIKDGLGVKNFGSDSRLIKEKNIETFIFIENFIFYRQIFIENFMFYRRILVFWTL
ncbi:MAG: hypothetical protein QG646_3230 [Euryarchaeota archaeon]|nr:hypothetical protein [Euryarchaeota archaeon]